MSGEAVTKAAPGIRLESVTVNPCCVEIRKSQEPLGNREGAAGRLEAPSQNTAFAGSSDTSMTLESKLFSKGILEIWV